MASDANAAGAGGPQEQDGLSSVEKVVELADQLSACADELHARIMREIRVHEGKPVPQAVRQAARRLLDD